MQVNGGDVEAQILARHETPGTLARVVHEASRHRLCCFFRASRIDRAVAIGDAGAQDDEHVDGLVDFITSVFDTRP